MNKAKQPTHWLDGFFYRVGAHGYVYRWGGSEWIKSTVTRADLKLGKRVNSFYDLIGG